MDKKSYFSYLNPGEKVLTKDNIPLLESLLEGDRFFKKRKKKLPLKRIRFHKKEEETETSYKTRDDRGPLEYTGPETAPRNTKRSPYQNDIPDSTPSNQGRLENKRHNKPKIKPKVYKMKRTSQKTSDHVSEVEKSCVYVFTYINETNSVSTGTGFFINQKQLLTCAHVVLPNRFEEEFKGKEIKYIKILLKDGLHTVKLNFYSIDLDFAILELDSQDYDAQKHIKPIRLGNSDLIKKGDDILAVGFPSIFKSLTVQKGIIANIQNKYFLYSDSYLLSGDSGCPIYNLEQKAVIGIGQAVIDMPHEFPVAELVRINAIKTYLNEKHIKYSEEENKEAKISNDLIKQSTQEISKQLMSFEKYTDPTDWNVIKESLPGGGGGRIRKVPRRLRNPDSTGNSSKVIKIDKHLPQVHDPSSRHLDSTFDSSPFDEIRGQDRKIYDSPLIKERDKKIFNEEKGYWVCNIPLGRDGFSDHYDLQIYQRSKQNDKHYIAYYKDKQIAESIKSKKNPNPLLSLYRKLKKRFNFDQKYYDYIDEYSAYVSG